MEKQTLSQRFSRRRVLSIVALAGAGAVAWRLGLTGNAAGVERVTETRVLMGTIVNLTLVGPNPAGARQAIQATLDAMAELEAGLSRFRPDSELSRLNATGRLEGAGRPLLEILDKAAEISRLSNGAFDVTVKPLLDAFEQASTHDQLPPQAEIEAARARVGYQRIERTGDSVRLAMPGMSITLDGIAKGYIVDAAVGVLKARGYADVLVEAGGDMMGAGSKEAGAPWKIAVQSPRKQAGATVASFTLSNRAVATSGDYMSYYTPDLRNHHIVDPRTGHSPQELASASVVAPNATLADALATTVMVLGSDAGLSLVSGLGGEALVVTKDLRVLRTAGFPA